MAHRSRFIGTGAIVLATGMLIALPTFSSGATVKNELRSFAPAQTRVGPADDPKLKPPLHGTNPHGQGTAAVIDLSPNAARPFTVDPKGNAGDEDIVIGRSRGEQRADNTYHGHITVAALFGTEIIGRDTLPGQTIDNETIDQGLLNSVLGCTATSGICLDLVRVSSSTTATGSTNSFSLASAALGGAAGVPALRVGAAESTGNITSDGTCQTATGGSRVADVRAATAIASVATSNSESRACRGQAPTQTNTSRVVELGGTGLGVPAAGCADGTPDTPSGLPVLLELICNADDSSATSPAGNQADAPYGVRNALDVYVLAVAGLTPLAQVSTAQSESRAVAPAAVTTTPTTTTTTPTTTTTTPTTTTTTPTATTPTATTPAATTPTVATPPVTDTPPAPADDVPGPGDDTGGDDPTGDDDGGGGDGNGGSTECSDRVDNDGDGKVDFGNDPGCSSASDDSEADNVRLSGNELPFTGTDVVVLGLAGSILLAAGLTLRGPARRREGEL